ncbi:FecR family protein [Eilatimonas milleporae]|uniref:FecR family protein n=1 Tax=Eilatimonas milleporae TaxID=911205 RepID=A0A3M0CWW4_9PROT|nr:FecR domain-containing protein [Eilatimonas milleporae]RMB11876.1 FecR family protein [Eilatimonas milleporae]
MNTLREDEKELSRIAHEWRERVQSASATDADHQALQTWLDQDSRHEDAYDRALTYWAAFDHLRPEDIDPDLMPSPSAVRQIPLLEKTRDLIAATRLRFAAMAAAIVIIALPATLFITAFESGIPTTNAELSTFTTGVSETKTVTLKDGTIVTLGALSEIEILMSHRKRSVQLKNGDAFFDVARDASRPFSVNAGDLTARALGTKFDVRSNGGVFRVAVAEGLVEVAYPYVLNGKAIDFKKRQMLGEGREIAATQKEGLRPVRDVAPDTVGVWRNRKLVYDGATLAELVADANRYDARRITLSDSALIFADETITASFDANNVDRMLRMLALSFPVTIDQSDPDIVRIRARDNEDG